MTTRIMRDRKLKKDNIYEATKTNFSQDDQITSLANYKKETLLLGKKIKQMKKDLHLNESAIMRKKLNVASSNSMPKDEDCQIMEVENGSDLMQIMLKLMSQGNEATCFLKRLLVLINQCPLKSCSFQQSSLRYFESQMTSKKKSTDETRSEYRDNSRQLSEPNLNEISASVFDYAESCAASEQNFKYSFPPGFFQYPFDYAESVNSFLTIQKCPIQKYDDEEEVADASSVCTSQFQAGLPAEHETGENIYNLLNKTKEEHVKAMFIMERINRSIRTRNAFNKLKVTDGIKSGLRRNQMKQSVFDALIKNAKTNSSKSNSTNDLKTIAVKYNAFSKMKASQKNSEVNLQTKRIAFDRMKKKSEKVNVGLQVDFSSPAEILLKRKYFTHMKDYSQGQKFNLSRKSDHKNLETGSTIDSPTSRRRRRGRRNNRK